MSIRDGARPLPAGPIGNFFRGFRYPIEAWGFISKNNLWGMALVSIIINVLLLVVLIFMTIYFLWPLLGDLDALLAGLSDYEWVKVLLAALSWLLTFLAVILAVVGNALVLLLLGQAIASPFLDVLSEKVEALVLGAPEHPFSVGRTLRSIFVAVSDLLWSLIFLIAINLPLFFIGIIIPGIGTSISGAVSVFFAALLLAQEFIGLPLARHLVSYRKRWRGVWGNRAISTGFGSAALMLLMVPGVNLLLLPLVTVGGTLAYCDLQNAGRLALVSGDKSQGGDAG